MGEKWERQPGESTRAFDGFCLYRDLGRDRSIDKAYWAHRQRSVSASAAADFAASPKPYRSPGHWFAWSSANAWEARAAAYDAHLELLARAKREAEHDAELDEFRKRSRQSAIRSGAVAARVLDLVTERLDDITVEMITPELLASLIRAAAHVTDSSLNAEAEAIGVKQLIAVLLEER